MKNLPTKRQVNYFIYFAAVLGALILVSGLLSAQGGRTYNESEFTTYHNALLSPEEIHNLSAAEAEKLTSYGGDGGFSRVRTSVINLDLKQGEVYGIYAQNFTYASNIYVDGKLLYSLGTVSETKDGFVPKTASFTVYFTAGEHTEIVVQRCNFDHARWSNFSFSLGEQSVITRKAELTTVKSLAVIVFLFTVGIINLGLFAGVTGRKQYLWFSLSCFSILINNALTNPKPIMLLFPDLNWYAGHKLESCSLVLTGLFIILFLRDCFEKKQKPKWLIISDCVMFGVALVYFIALPVSIYSKYVFPFGIIGFCYALLYFVYYALWIHKNRENIRPVQYCYVAGILIIVAAIMFGAFHINFLFLNVVHVGLIAFEIIMTLTLSVEFRNIQEAYEKSKENEEQLRKMNEGMEQTVELQRNFLEIMNHELRTPLTVIAGYADISAMSLKNEEQNGEIIRNMQIVKQEALRLGRIIEQSESGAKSAVALTAMTDENLLTLLKEARAFCEPICEKRSNKISIDCTKDIFLCCMRDSIIQMLYNLIINASRHTENGEIRLIAFKNENGITVTVKDNGEGIDAETAEMAFVKGYSADGGHGLGLAVCREVVRLHGGTIGIEPNKDKGTSVTAVFPTRQQ